MMILKIKFRPSFNKILIGIVAVLALIGLADSTYLTAEHFYNQSTICLLNQKCDIVLTTKYSSVGFIPTALFGVIYYLTVLLLIFGWFQNQKTRNLSLASAVVSLGLIASAGFVYIQAEILKAFCTWCLISAGITTLMWMLLLILNLNNKALGVITKKLLSN